MGGSSGSADGSGVARRGAATLPVQLHVRGRRCVVVGGGPVGARRAASLADAGADVVVVAIEPGSRVRSLAAEGRVELRRRAVRDDDVSAAFLVVAATGVPEVDARVGELATSAGALVNRADDATEGSISFPAVVRRGPVAVAVSTGGRSPAVARWAAGRLEQELDAVIGLSDDGYGTLVELVEEVRGELRVASGDVPGGSGTPVTHDAPDWRTALDASILDLIDQGRRAEAKERLKACLSSS